MPLNVKFISLECIYINMATEVNNLRCNNVDYHSNENIELFLSRNEPQILRDPKRDGQFEAYKNLRTTKDINLVQSLKDILISGSTKNSENYVLGIWISPAFGKIRGYGIYTMEEAIELSRRSIAENWGSPVFGPIYDLNWLECKLKRLKGPSAV